MWSRQVRGCFVLKWGWQSLYLLLSDRILFDLQLHSVFYLWSDDLSPREQAALTAPPLPLSVQLHLACFMHNTHTHTVFPSSKSGCIQALHMCSHVQHRIYITHTHTVHLKSGLGPRCTTRSVSSLLQDGCLLSNTLHKRQLKGMCDTGCVWERESRDKKKSENETGHEWASRKREKVYKGECTAPPLLHNHDWYCVYWSLLQ